MTETVRERVTEPPNVTADRLRWLDPQAPDTRDVSGAVAVLEACRRVDAPHWLPTTTATFLTMVVHGWEGDRAETAVLYEDGRVVGVLQVTLPSWDNRHLGQIDVYVDPALRRRGIGRGLYAIGAERIRAAGRTLVVAEAWDTPAAQRFGELVGLERAMVEVQRYQDLTLLDRTGLAARAAAAAAHATDYELVRLPGPVPDELLDTVVELAHAINDAPMDDLEIEDEVFSPERLRAFEETTRQFGRRIYRVMARHRETGEPAGHTVVAVEEQFPWFGHQYDTSVVRAHRGHRLGLWLKAAMLDWLGEVEPQLTVVGTWNAATNDHMVGVNEELGYHVVGTAVAWQQRL